jgi:hypothetical protein
MEQSQRPSTSPTVEGGNRCINGAEWAAGRVGCWPRERPASRPAQAS